MIRVGDRVTTSLEGKVTEYASDNHISVTTDDGREYCYSLSEIEKVAPAKTPPPKGGTIIRVGAPSLYPIVYIVDKYGKLHTIRDDGTTDPSISYRGGWDALDQAEVEILS